MSETTKQPENQPMAKQLDAKSQNDLGLYLSRKMDAGAIHIEKICQGKTSLTAKERAEVDYQKTRIAQLQVSYLLVFNTARIWPLRQENIDRFTKILKETTSPTEKQNLGIKITLLINSLKCNKCNKRGYTGFNETKGEFVLCTCTLKTAHLH